MATVRISLNAGEPAYLAVQAVGAPVVTKKIELSYDIGALQGAGMSANQIRMQVINALIAFEAWIETSGKFLTAG